MHRRNFVCATPATGSLVLALFVALTGCSPASESGSDAGQSTTETPTPSTELAKTDAAEVSTASALQAPQQGAPQGGVPQQRASSFARLREFSIRIGRVYGTEDWSIFLYSLVRLHKPMVVVELGTGYAVTAFWMAQGLKENQQGHLWTLDDGRGFEYPVRDDLTFVMNEIPMSQRRAALKEYFDRMSKQLELEGTMTLLTDSMPPFPEVEEKIDLLFSDFDHGPKTVLSLLAFYLPRMSAFSSILVHSGSSHLETYLTLEQTVEYLNQGKVPLALLERVPAEARDSLVEFVRRSDFQLIHLTTPQKVHQNSTAWLKVQPADLRPYPLIKVPFFHEEGSDESN